MALHSLKSSLSILASVQHFILFPQLVQCLSCVDPKLWESPCQGDDCAHCILWLEYALILHQRVIKRELHLLNRLDIKLPNCSEERLDVMRFLKHAVPMPKFSSVRCPLLSRLRLLRLSPAAIKRELLLHLLNRLDIKLPNCSEERLDVVCFLKHAVPMPKFSSVRCPLLSRLRLLRLSPAAKMTSLLRRFAAYYLKSLLVSV